MQKVNVFQFYSLGHMVHPLTELKAEGKVKDSYYMLYSAQIWIDFVLMDNLVPIGVARPACQTLSGAIKSVIGESVGGAPPSPDMEKEITPWDAYSISSAAKTFETVLAAQLQSLSTYFVSRKLGYETALLIEEGDKLLPDSIHAEVPEAMSDLRQAGKCIAFDIPTAAGFHIVRATEAVIRKYYAAVVGVPPKTKMRNWVTYINNLRAKGADDGVTGFLQHITDTYRKPVFHL